MDFGWQGMPTLSRRGHCALIGWHAEDFTSPSSIATEDILLARKIPRPTLSRSPHLVALNLSILGLQHQAKIEGEEKEPPHDDGSWGYRGA